MVAARLGPPRSQAGAGQDPDLDPSDIRIARVTGGAVTASDNLAVVPATVAECEGNQTRWNLAIALAGGGFVWEDRGLQWSWQAHDGQLTLSFPRAIDPDAAEAGVEFARARDAQLVGAWLSQQSEATALEAIGFERGWEPCWMAAPLDAVLEPDDPRTALSADVPEYGPNGQRLLSLARGGRPRAWHAVARLDGHFAGRAWCLLDGDVAGVYDMDVWPQFQRRGLGRALLHTVCDAARRAGATRAVLNATPAGEPLYQAEGFVHVGHGITYWHHLSATCGSS
jgi:GNAT superfamily N-acetyltransferase